MIRYAIGSSPAPAADEREYIFDKPHFLGTKRNGPDLSRVGGKYSDDWHYSHLFNPAQMVPGSIMPSFTWLYTNRNPADSGQRSRTKPRRHRLGCPLAAHWVPTGRSSTPLLTTAKAHGGRG